MATAKFFLFYSCVLIFSSLSLVRCAQNGETREWALEVTSSIPVDGDPDPDSGDDGPGASDHGGGDNGGGHGGCHQDDDRDAMRACAEQLHDFDSVIRVVSKQSAIVVNPNEIVLVKVTGNHGDARIVLNGGDSDSDNDVVAKGLCVMVSGNQGQALVDVNRGVRLQAFAYVGRGHESSGRVTVAAGAALDNATRVDLSGSRASFSLTGDGQYSCKDVGLRLHGNHPSYRCGP